MKRLIAAFAGTVLVVLAMPTWAFGQALPGDSVTGDASDCVQVLSNGLCELHSVRVDARSGASGRNPSGTVRYGFSFGTPSSSGFGEGPVTCIAVTGHVARIGFAAHEFGEFIDFFAAGFVTVTDGGGPNSRLDRFSVFTSNEGFDPVPGPTDCSAPVAAPAFENDEGDLIVVDAPAFPTSKDQCKHGGWRNFPGFKNQGDCVSFVASGDAERGAR